MTWTALQRTVAEVAAARVSGSRCAGGALLTIELSLRITEWPWEQYGALTLVPRTALVTAETRQGALLLGIATPRPEHVVTPMKHSSTSTLQYTIALSMAALAELESARNGAPLKLAMNLVAHPILAARRADVPIYPTSMPFSFKVPPDEWLAVLDSAGFAETLITELQLPTAGPPATTAGRARFAQAIVARNNGAYAEVMRRCRITLNELGKLGLGGRPRRTWLRSSRKRRPP